MTESAGYRLNYAIDHHEEELNDTAQKAIEQLHGAVNTPVKDENDLQELVTRFRAIGEAATCVADTLCQGNEETGRLMIHELDRTEELLFHSAVHHDATQDEIGGHMDSARTILELPTPHDPLEWQNSDRWKEFLTEMLAKEFWEADMAASGLPRQAKP